MRRLPSLAMLLVGACAQPAPPYQPPPPPSLTAQGLPQTYEACVQSKAALIPHFYDVFLECRMELVYYAVQLPGTQEQKAELVDALERKAMSRAQDAVTARHGTASPPLRF